MSTPRTSILVVDDDPDLLRLMQIRLTAAGYAVSTAESAERALAQVSATRPQLVVTDLRMGGMDGMALFEAIRSGHPMLPVIILTAHGTIPDAVAAVQRGVSGYLTKPFDPKALLTEVERALAMAGGARAAAAGPGRRPPCCFPTVSSRPSAPTPSLNAVPGSERIRASRTRLKSVRARAYACRAASCSRLASGPDRVLMCW